ncbi:MAG: YlxR family protein [Propionibacteriaceae bacterium]
MPAPLRTCIGCRARDEKALLLRLIAHDAGVEIDIRQVLPGRGAYLHPRPGCLEQALKRRNLGRALRSEIDGQQTAVKIRQFLSALT